MSREPSYLEIHMAADTFLTKDTGACAEKSVRQVVAAPAQQECRQKIIRDQSNELLFT